MDSYFLSHSNGTTESYISLQNDVAFALVVASVVIALINTGIHSIAAYIFLTVQKKSSQIIDLINLSTIQAVVSCLVFLDEGAELVYDSFNIEDEIANVLKLIDCYLFIMIYVAFCLYYIGMSLLILDRFLLVYLHLQYEVYWSPYKSKCIIVASWTVSLVIDVLLCVIHWYGFFNYQAVLSEIISPTFNAGLVTFAAVVYVYLFCKFRQSRNKNPMLPRSTDKRKVMDGLLRKRLKGRKESVYDTFRNSRFYLDLLMVVSFIGFLVIPNLVYLCNGWDGRQRTHEAKDANKVSYMLLFLINFILCVIMHPDVRRFCQRTLLRRRNGKGGQIWRVKEEE